MKVSICICTYNQGNYIEKAILSANSQTVMPSEIIVSDDCSTDNTKNVLDELKKNIPILKVVHQKVNLGIAKNTDTCLRMAQGDIIIRLDSDDYLSPKYTEKLLQLLEENPNAGYAHAAIQEIDQNGSYLKIRKLFRSQGFQDSADALRAALTGYRVAANILMFRKEALEKVQFLANRPNFGEDYHLTASISAAGYGNVYCSDVLAYYRVWVDSAKTRQRRKMNEVIGIRRVFDEVLEPAFRDRKWSTFKIKASKKRFACRHADCLSWNIYNHAEKIELSKEIKKLSSSTATKLVIWIYLNNLGSILRAYNTAKALPKLLIKTVMKFN